MADISKAMGPEGKVALGTECLKAMTQMEDFRNAAKGLVQQVQGTVNGLRADYSGEGAEKFYAACESNIQQINAMIDNTDEMKRYSGLWSRLDEMAEGK